MTQVAALRLFLQNLTTFRYIEYIPQQILKDLFIGEKHEHAKVLVKYLIDTLSEVAYYDHKQKGTGKKAQISLIKNNDFQLCIASVYLLIRLIAFIMKDP